MVEWGFDNHSRMSEVLAYWDTMVVCDAGVEYWFGADGAAYGAAYCQEGSDHHARIQYYIALSLLTSFAMGFGIHTVMYVAF